MNILKQKIKKELRITRKNILTILQF